MSRDQVGVHAAREQVARLLALVPYLQAHGEVRLTDAATALDVDVAQLEKDLRVLFMCGLPGGYPDDLIDVDLEALEGEGVIRVGNADYLARPVRFAPSEAAALVVALRAVEQGTTPQTRELVERTLAKLEAAGASSAAERIHIEPQDAAGEHVRPAIEAAIGRGRQLEIDYHVPSRDERTTRVVEPRTLSRIGEVTYLDAWCHSAHGDRLFRLDRMLAVRELDTPVSERAGERRDLSSGWFAGDDEVRQVTVRLAPPAQWIPEYYPVLDTRPAPEGAVDVDLEVASETWLLQLLLRVAPHGSVVAPAHLAEALASSAQAALNLYGVPGVR